MGKALLLGVLLAAGCGATDGEPVGDPQPALVGNWILTDSNCGVAADFTATNYVIGTVCPGPGGTFNAQAQTGTYSATHDRIDFTAVKSTCPTDPVRTFEMYTLAGSTLILSDPAGAEAFMRNDAPPSSVALTYGCFSNGAFTASPLAPL